jgi:predicted AlkP superfamily pyrophosphatase or phosphodiesterase
MNVVGLTPALLTQTPRLAALGRAGYTASMGAVLPAVTCSAQATMLTGRMPREHGVVANGWYYRDTAEVALWKQANSLVGCEEDKLWHVGRDRFGADFTVAKMFWWFNMYADVQWSATPRPVYPADGRKVPSIYTEPPELKADLQGALGTFPLFNFWGPTADVRSSQWIADATPEARRACTEIDAVAGDLGEWAANAGYTVVALSEYGITPVRDGVHINRALRQAGLLRAQQVDLGWELLDAGASEAFAVADHQIAHVYVKRPGRVPEVRALLEGLEGVAQVLDRGEQAAVGLDHARSGELVVLSKPDRWFTYYYWLDDARMPDFARTVDIHRKPGYDPVELRVDPTIPLPKLKAGLTLARKMLGFRYYMRMIGLDASLVRGSHGLLPARAEDGPVFLCTDPAGRRDHLAMTDVRDTLLELVAGAPHG